MFGFEDSPPEGAVSDVQYINWLLMARAGLTGLEFYTPETGQWRQAHMQARYVILQVHSHLVPWLSCWCSANLPTPRLQASIPLSTVGCCFVSC